MPKQEVELYCLNDLCLWAINKTDLSVDSALLADNYGTFWGREAATLIEINFPL